MGRDVMNTYAKGCAAFPVQGSDELSSDPGMSLRDYFAAQAMNGVLNDPNLDMSGDEIARWAYAIADAMLKERAA